MLPTQGALDFLILAPRSGIRPPPPPPSRPSVRVLILCIFMVLVSLSPLFLLLLPAEQWSTTTHNDGDVRLSRQDSVASNDGSGGRLAATTNRTFTIAILTDLHFGEEEHGWGVEQDRRSTETMRGLLRAEAFPKGNDDHSHDNYGNHGNDHHHQLSKAYGGYNDIYGTHINTANTTNNTTDHTSHPNGIQLVVLNGDLITGENTFSRNSTHYLDHAVVPVEELGIPWASVYGNHDSKFNLSRLGIYEREKAHAGSMTGRMVVFNNGSGEDVGVGEVGVTNYYLIVWDSPDHRRPRHTTTTKTTTYGTGSGREEEEGEEKPLMILWFFDSRGGATYQNSDAIDLDDIPNHVSPHVAHWYRDTRRALREKWGRVMSLAFVHIPPRVYLRAQQGQSPPLQAQQQHSQQQHGRYLLQQGQQQGQQEQHKQRQDPGKAQAYTANPLNPRTFPGINKDNPLSHQGTLAHEDQPFEAELHVAGADGLRAVFVGHDHDDGWCSVWPTPESTADTPSGAAITPDSGPGEAAATGEQEDTTQQHEKESHRADRDTAQEVLSPRRENEWEDKPPFLCFARHSSHGGYGRGELGARVVRVSWPEEDGEWGYDDIEVETWVRLESGGVMDRVWLNGTYGVDDYGA